MLVGVAKMNATTRSILSTAIEVHRVLGPGLLESAYQPCFCYELSVRRHQFAAQRIVPLTYKDAAIAAHYRLDLIVDELVVVELKSVDALAPVHRAQMLTYLKLTGCPVGLLINFNVPRLMDGVKRVLLPTGGNGATGGSGVHTETQGHGESF